jgi:hypothetical protein
LIQALLDFQECIQKLSVDFQSALFNLPAQVSARIDRVLAIKRGQILQRSNQLGVVDACFQYFVEFATQDGVLHVCHPESVCRVWSHEKGKKRKKEEEKEVLQVSSKEGTLYL